MLAGQISVVVAQSPPSGTGPSITITPPAATPDVRGPLPAPVGHRQPRASDIPQDQAKSEARGDAGFRDLDAKLRICKGC
jgi:hypothetical protein